MTHMLELPRRIAFTGARWLPLCLIFGSGSGQAAWVSDGQVRLDTYYDDNVTLASAGSEGSLITRAHGEAEVRQVTESSQISAVAGISYLDYAESQANGEDLTDEDIEYIDIQSRFRSDRFAWGLRGSLRRDVTLATVGFIRDPIAPLGGGVDSATPDGSGLPSDAAGGIADAPGTEGNVDAGSVVQQIRRYETRVNPYFDYELSELTTAQLAYYYQRLDYQQGESAGLENSQSNATALTVRRNMTERDSARIVFAAARFDPELSSKADSYQVTAGWERGFSQTAGGSFDAGVSYRDQDGRVDSGLVIRIRGFRTTEVGRLFLQMERSLLPTGLGDLAETDRLNFGIQRALSDTLRLGVRGDASRTTNTNDNDRDYISVGPELTWSLTPGLSLGATYRYRWADRQGDPGGGASGNSVGIFISYQPPREL